MIRYYLPLLGALVFTGCIKKQNIEVTGIASGIKDGVFIVKNLADSTVYGVNIKDGKFSLPGQPLKEPGYYMASITINGSSDIPNPFEVYLEPGKYTLQTEEGKLYQYPKITSPSKIQDQLSVFHALTDKAGADASQQVKQLSAQLRKKGNSSPAVYNALLSKLSAAEAKMVSFNIIAFKEFVKQYPASDITAHLMLTLDYETDPVSYYNIYKTFAPAAKASDEGKELNDKLSHMIKLVVGAKAPPITGKTADGKPFDPKTIRKKLILIDFWRAGDDISRQNHDKLHALLNQEDNDKKLDIISVSLDTRSDWWLTAINQDHMAWAQVSDLKGDDSPNAVNWSITTIPTYYLLNSNWTIVERNIDIGNLDFEVSDYIKNHR